MLTFSFPGLFRVNAQLRREKVEMENALEQEQEFIVNKLRAELDRRQDETKSLREQLEQVRECLVILHIRSVMVWTIV